MAKAITATAYKLARIIYAMLKYGMAYVAQGREAYEAAYRERLLRNLKRKAGALGYELTPLEGRGGSRSEAATGVNPFSCHQKKW